MNVYCQTCKKTGVSLVVNSRRMNSKGEEKISYLCRMCKTTRIREYRKTPEGKSKTYEAVYKSMRKLREKQNARQRVYKAVKTGSLNKLNCAICSSPKTEAHYQDYSYPLLVMWYCRSHHADIHRQIM